MSVRLLTKPEAIREALARFDQRYEDAERAILTRLLTADGDADLDAIDEAIAWQRAQQARGRAALEHEMETNLRDGRLIRVRIHALRKDGE